MRHINRKKILCISVMMPVIFLLACLFLCLYKEKGRSGKEIYINEVCSSNIGAYINEDGESPDYIEIFNGGERETDLKGWKLSTGKNKGEVFLFPEIIVPARGFVVIDKDDEGNKISLSSKGARLILSDPGDNIIDSMEVPTLKYNTVYGRVNDGGKQLKRLTPSPLFSNSGAKEVSFPSLKSPEFSAESGFYDEPFMLSLTSPEGGEIRYTLDGSEPGEGSFIYTSPIQLTDPSDNNDKWSVSRNASVYLYDYYERFGFHIPTEKTDKCNVVRAKVYGRNGEVSDTVTKSYFVGFNKKPGYDGIKILSLVSDPDGFFGSEKGIYVLGDIGLEDLHERYNESEEASELIKKDPSLPLDGSVKIGDIGYNRGSDGNYMQHGPKWEREADITLFYPEDPGKPEQQKAGIRIKGNASRQYPGKSFNIYARNAYSGKDSFDISFFDGAENRKKICLSSGGNDFYTLSKDLFISGRIRDCGLEVASAGFFDPVFLFLNGEFWGTYIISERLDEDYFASEYGVDRDNVIFIKEGNVAAGRKDDIHYYYVFLSLYEDKDFSDPGEYGKFCEEVDITSLMEYYSLRVYSDYGIDWPHMNYGIWRCRDREEGPYGDCKWRFVNFDNNNTLKYEKIDTDMMDVLFNGTKYFGPDGLFISLMKNDEFRKDFYRVFKRVSENVFLSGEAGETYENIRHILKAPVSRNYKRYFKSDSGFDDDFFEKETQSILDFIRERNGFIEDRVREYCR